MGPEDNNRKGQKATERLVALFEGLGWTLKGRTDVDAPLEGIPDPDRNIGYGIDAYLVYDDPHGPHTQGIIIESKCYDWKGIIPSNIEKFFNQILDTLENAPQSDEFESRFNFEAEADLTNSGILAIWATGDFDSDQFRSYVNQLEIPHKWDLCNILILGNDELVRLARLEKQYHQLKQEYEDHLKIFYPDLTDESGGRRDLITFDYLFSRYVFATIDNQNIAIVFYFDEMSIESLKFMSKALNRYQLIANNNEIHVYVPDRGYETQPVESEFKSQWNDQHGDRTELEFKTLDTATDLSHLDNR